MVLGIRKVIRGRRIRKIWCDWPPLIKGISLAAFQKTVSGAVAEGVERRGKNIIIFLGKKISGKKEKFTLLIHPKMTGHFLAGRWELSGGKWHSLLRGPTREKVNGFIHLMFTFGDGTMLALSDVRKFAKVLLEKRKSASAWPKETMALGPDPFDRELTKKKFVALLLSKRGRIKRVLMRQDVVSGIGNIYSDDILWAAKIHPLTPVSDLSARQAEIIYRKTLSILKKSLRLGGASISNYRNIMGEAGGYGRARLVYAREGEECSRCHAIIKRIKTGGRSARFCPRCQKI